MTDAAHPEKQPLRFGVQMRGARSAAEWLDEARRAEDAGFDVLTMPDHIGAQLAPMPALTAAAAVTSRIRLGTWVLANDFRHPAMLAKEAATLDLLSEGRLELGVGAGWMDEDYEQTGIPRDRPGVRIERLAEALKIARGLWADGPFTFDGKHYRVRALDGDPRPIQDPLPVQVGGGGRRILSLAAREANIVGLGMRLGSGVIGPEAGRSLTAEATDEKISWVREAAGSRWPGLVLNARVTMVAVCANANAGAADVGGPNGLADHEVMASPHAFVGDLARIEDHVRACRERWGLSYFTVGQTALEALAPLVGRLAGS